ncbi:MAG: CoB--CoM heterodisulfide reductase iron-sulfur subunit A family protein [Bacteroidetes bacterium]|nr:CoB--CoM heterodisulfide reductase iron-sulfur subunit A family protein [Bacteroidota bacterium]
MRVKIGICYYDSNSEYASLFNNDVIIEYAKSIPSVEQVWIGKVLELTASDLASLFKSSGVEKIVIAGDYPGLIKNKIDLAMKLAGLDRKKLALASFSEHALFNGQSTEMAKAVLLCAVNGLDFREVAKPGHNTVNKDTLVIGGGIAGIQASLEIANGGQKVYLLEKSGTIGGHMAMFDKTFPTLDCAACILTPKMVDVGQHPNIELITYSELKEVQGDAGDFKVKINKKARRVNISTCIGCGNCAEKCPRKAASEFDADTSLRKAIYIPFPQAVPNKYLIDADNCTYVENGKCGVCVKICPVPDCINLDEKDSEIEINVGNIILATGFKVFDAKKIERYGYGQFPNVLTSLEFERLINAAGPTEGNITYRKKDKKGNWVFKEGNGEPQSVGIIHCVGSRDENNNKYCSKVCCMYSLKLAHLVREKLPDAIINEYYIDMRAFGKGYEEFYERIKTEGINMIRGKTATIKQKGEKLLLRSEDMLNDRMLEDELDMVILAVGLEPANKASELAKMLKITQDGNGWYNESNSLSDPVNTNSGGVSIAGLCQGPKDIPDTVAQASAAASRVLQNIINNKVEKSVFDLSFKDIENRVNELITEVKS